MNTRLTGRWSPRRDQAGAALAVGLILLLVLTVLAISGVITSTSELRMSANQQQQELAFQAAETGLERAFVAADFNTSAIQTACGIGVQECEPVAVDATEAIPLAGKGTFAWEVRPDGDEEAPGVVVGASVGSFQAYYFVAESTGEGPGNARSVHEQGFYIVGPGE